jgi:hypothetical protein
MTPATSSGSTRTSLRREPLRPGRRFVASRTAPTYGSVAPQRRSRAECQYVLEALGDIPLRVAYERLAGMVRMLGEDVQAMALRNAYAIDMPAPDTFTRRRERIAGIHGLSIDTIELYKRNMIDELALRLVHGELPVGS